MKNLLMLIVVGMLAASGFGSFTQNFDNFQLGTLVEQHGWEAHSLVSVVETSNDGLYVGGRALNASGGTDRTTRGLASGYDFGLDIATADYIRMSFDVRQGTNPNDGSTLWNSRMYLRDGNTANYSASFGVQAGVVAFRPSGEQGDTFTGNNLASSQFYGSENDWVKGEWLRFTLTLSGDNFNIATIDILNLSRGGTVIESGFVNYDTGVDYKSKAAAWNRPNVRLGTGDTYIDNITVVPEPATLALIGLGGLFIRKRK